MRFFFNYLKKRRLEIIVFLLFVLIFLVTFLLYDLPIGAVVYPAVLCAAAGAAILVYDFLKAKKRHEKLEKLAHLSAQLIDLLPSAVSQDDEDYQKIILHLKDEQRFLATQSDRRYADMIEYYTVWVHQIKTPIASMRLTLQNEDSPLARSIRDDLFRIEQYVEMVLCYLRLDSDTTDFVIAEVDLDKILRQAFRRFSGQFISKKLTLHYTPVHEPVLTDEKWLLFVIEQLLSNAVKYTPAGGVITVTLDQDGVLVLQDTGIGIAPGDLPRVFERGYTGLNGRTDKRASGLGLYLCKRICQNLRHAIRVTSAPGQGTAVYLTLRRDKLEIE